MKLFSLLLIGCMLSQPSQVYGYEKSSDIPLLKEARFLGKSGKYTEAIEKLKDALAQAEYANNRKVRLYLGLMYYKIKDYDNSLAEFSHTIELDSCSPMAYYFLGMIYEAKAVKTKVKEERKAHKQKALENWQSFMACHDNEKMKLPTHKNIGVKVKKSVKTAKKHIKTLLEDLKDE